MTSPSRQCVRRRKLTTLVLLHIATWHAGLLYAEDKIPLNAGYGPNVRTLTVSGTIDPRLYASVRTTYRPTEYDEQDKACARSDWNTARGKGMLDWEVERVKHDENNRYKVTVPIDYVRDNRCGYEYVDTSIHIKRDERDDQYANITLLSGSRNDYDNYGTKGKRFPDDANIQSRKTTKPYYRLAQGSYIQCHTDSFEEKDDQHVLFTCYPLGGNGDHGINDLSTTNMEVDIRINEEFSKHYIGPAFNVRSEKDHFRDYIPPPQGFFERLKGRVEQLLN